MAILRIVLLMLVNFCASSLTLANGLTGVWAGIDQPAVIEIKFAEGVGKGTVIRDAEKPKAVGVLLLKDIEGKTDKGPWSAQIFVKRLNAYKDASISLLDSGEMEINVKVGFISKTVKWRRE